MAYIGLQEVDCEVQILIIYWRIKIKKWNLNPKSKLKACVVFCLLLLELLYNTMHLYYFVIVLKLLINDHVSYWKMIIFTFKQELPKYVWHVLTSACTIRHAHSYIAYTKSCMMTITTVTVEISSPSIETRSPQNMPHPRQELALGYPYTPYDHNHSYSQNIA